MNRQSEEFGFLIVNVKTANGALPLENASVTVYSSPPPSKNNEPSLKDTDVIFSLRTDENGKTQKVALKTKPLALSQTPDERFPNLTYNILVTRDGYYDNTYLNVPIFEGITSVQEVLLIPLSEFSSPTDPIPNSQRQYQEKID